MRDDFTQDYTSLEETMVRNHDLTLPLPFLDIPHENLHWTFCREDQYTPHQEEKIQKNPINRPEKTDTLWITAIVEKRTYPNSTKSSEHNA
jgi:hypothetical protein